MREPAEACELIDKIVEEIENHEANEETTRLFIIQGGQLLKAAAEGTEDDVRQILIAQEIQNRLIDQTCLLCGCLSQALNEVPEGKLKQRMLRISRVRP